MKPVNVAVVGTGHLGRIHARILQGLPEFSLVAVVDPVPAALERATREFQVPGFGHVRDLTGKIDAAIVAAPTCFHYEVAVELLASGVHLLVEKPLAPTHAQAAEMCDLAARHGALLQVGHVERFNPALAAAVPHVGSVKYIDAVRRSGFSFRSTDIGVVLDLMIHDIDVTLSLVRSPLRHVEAIGLALFGRHEDVATARLVFENGCVATISASRASRQPARTMDAWSTNGLVHVDFASRTADRICPSEAVLRGELDIERLSPAECADLKERLLDEHLRVEPLPVEPRDAITAELLDFAAGIRTGRPVQVSGEQGRDAVYVAERVLWSLNRHAWNGSPDGPVGPHGTPGMQILRGPHWHLRQGAPTEHREAG